MPKMIKLLVTSLLVFGVAAFFFSPRPAVGLESMPAGPPVPLMADPRDFFFRVVPSPERASLPAQSSIFSITYLPPGSNYMNDTCIAWPTEAQNAFNYAASQWTTYLHSSVPITINACWATSLAPPLLGHGGPRTISKDFSGAPLPNTWYPDALANALTGYDLDPGIVDMEIAFTSASPWYFGTDGNPGSGQYDFVSVVMHEIAHGLGFTGTMSVDNGGKGSWGQWWDPDKLPYVYDHFTENGSGQLLIDTFLNPSLGLGSQLIGNNLYFDGPYAKAANGGSRPKLYAPGTWVEGSSYAHLDEVYNGTADAMMTWSINSEEAIHVPGPILLGILQDLGWPVSSSGEEVYVSPSCGGRMQCYSSVQGGIDSGGAVLTVNISQDSYGENVILDVPSLTLRGGWNSTFDSQTSSTTIQGSLKVTNGTAIVENIVLR